ncbi:unnamed protein product [Triticum turgidum subsp. durum]|uniref:Uncharacterized protein n=1 Tax=Triticum turgidum subsp. durum TaxID=4567 RepID=A0A9R0Z322_TRITD|nr:unnamed protein product [Triticum turgidum subsp. durum]
MGRVEPADVKKVVTTLKRAVKVVGTPAYHEMVKNCMIQDLSWKGLPRTGRTCFWNWGWRGASPASSARRSRRSPWRTSPLPEERKKRSFWCMEHPSNLQGSRMGR